MVNLESGTSRSRAVLRNKIGKSKNTNMKAAGIILSILGLLFMVFSFIRDDIDFVLVGMIVVAIGNLITYYGRKVTESK